jgi:NADPH2:quinone reductase
MRAAQIVSLDGPSAVEVVDVPQPEPNDDQVLIRVRAAGVSFPEVLQTRGLYQLQPELPFVPGSEVAGEVVSAPAGSGLAPGDRVVALVILGGFAEHAVTQVDMVFPLPDSLSFEQGAAIPLNYMTAHFALVAGGIGTASIQVAKAFGAGKVIAVTSTPEKGEFATAAGADEVVLADGFKDTVKGAGGVDIVVDPVGGDRFTDSLRCLKEDGRLLVIGFADGDIPTVRVNRLLLNNVSVVGVGWGAYVYTRQGYVGGQWDALLPHLTSGAMTPPVGATFDLDGAADALLTLDERRATGKVLLTP